MSRLNLFTIFHLNLAYSSIEEEQRSEVVKRCYWPLLRLAREQNLPFGIEATGYTLKEIMKIDPAWVEELKSLVTEGSCEFVGSGYAQIIGALVPAKVNTANLRLGNMVYEQLINQRPGIALVNEQAYSAGLIQHYLDAGYNAIVMEWDNPFRFHPNWDPQWRYLPQVACGHYGEEIPLLWNKSIAFQKFQRYAHGDIVLDEYFNYLTSHLSGNPRAMPLYGNDVEIFNFRPGRYPTEASLDGKNEWERIEHLFCALNSDERFKLAGPSEVLDLLTLPGAGNKLSLESPEHPIPVKKQDKYNITRWAVTGRDDIKINTICERIYANLRDDKQASDEDWQELCYLWGSDFRTHITGKRWDKFQNRLMSFSKKWEKETSRTIENRTINNKTKVGSNLVRQSGRLLSVSTDSISLDLNCLRGLAIDKLHYKDVGPAPQIVTLPHGYFDDISLGADWYTGHLVHEEPGRLKITDLNPTEPEFGQTGNEICITGAIATPLGSVQKTVTVSPDEASVAVKYDLAWEAAPIGVLRIGHMTLNPEAFDKETLFFKTHSGGFKPDCFLLKGHRVEHGTPVSFLVSAESGVGMTEGWFEVGDAVTRLKIESIRSELAVIGLVTYREVGSKYFCRISFSVGELDETRQNRDLVPINLSFSLRISPA